MQLGRALAWPVSTRTSMQECQGCARRGARAGHAMMAAPSYSSSCQQTAEDQQLQLVLLVTFCVCSMCKGLFLVVLAVAAGCRKDTEGSARFKVAYAPCASGSEAISRRTKSQSCKSVELTRQLKPETLRRRATKGLPSSASPSPCCHARPRHICIYCTTTKAAGYAV
jgi:hypothetical protein